MDAVREDIIKLVEKELESANKMFPPFHSAHEGYAVILEEVEEVKDDIELLDDNLESTWNLIKGNYNFYSMECVKNIKSIAVEAAIELIQVAAMAQKFIDSLGGGENNL